MTKCDLCTTCLIPLTLLLLAGCSEPPPPVGAATAVPDKIETAAADMPATAPASQDAAPLPAIRGPHAGKDPHGALGPDKLLAVALQHQQEGRSFEAMRALDDAIRRYPADAQLHAVRGGLLLAEGKTAAALESLEMAHRLAPDDAEILVNRSQAYREFSRLDEAMVDLDRAVALNPDLLAARFNRGALRYAKGDFEGALADFDQCVALDPHAAAPYFNRASTYAALNRRADAIADLEHFIELSDNPAWTETANKLLEGWRKTPATVMVEGNTEMDGVSK